MTPLQASAERIRQLEIFNAELRGTLIFVGRELRKHTFGRRDSDLLKQLRRTPSDARRFAKDSKVETDSAHGDTDTKGGLRRENPA